MIDTATGEITFSDNQGNKSKHTPDALTGGNGQPARENVTLRDVVTFLAGKKKGDELETDEINKAARIIGHAESSIKDWLQPNNIGHPELQSVQITLLKKLINCEPALQHFGRQGLYEAAGLGRLYGDGTIQSMGQLAVALCLQKPGYSLPELESRAAMGAQYFHQQINLANGIQVEGAKIEPASREIIWNLAHSLHPEYEHMQLRFDVYSLVGRTDRRALQGAENPGSTWDLVSRVIFELMNNEPAKGLYANYHTILDNWVISGIQPDFCVLKNIYQALNDVQPSELGQYTAIFKCALKDITENAGQVDGIITKTLAAEAVNGRAHLGQNPCIIQ